MHLKKKRKLFVLYSIPINLCKRKYLVSYSIPLSCMVALLLGGVVAINSSLPLKSSAVTIQDEWVVKEKDNESTDNVVEDESVDDSFSGFGGDGVELSQADVDAGISLQSVIPAPTLAITVSNTGQEINAAQGGNTVYGSYNVSLTGSNVKDYTLSIKANSTNLTMPSGASSSTSTVSGAGGKTGNSMTANTWGYKLTETSTSESSYGTLNYASLPTSLQQIANGNVSSPYNLSVGKKLVFAAKFGDDATPGKYSGSIILSLSATPAQTGQLWSNGTPSYITDMQDISSGFCASSLPTGATITLKDNRGTSPVSYKIVKLKDDKCWMQENLALPGGTKLTSSDSDVNSDWTLPASATSWDTRNYQAVQMKNGASGMTVNSSSTGDGHGWQSNYGNYYSWCAATAESCKTNRTGSAITGGTAAESICPNNWHLPTGNTNGELYNALNGLNFTTVQQDPYKFSAAGYVNANAQLYHPGISGYYWSSTPYSNDEKAYDLLFGRSSFYPDTDSSTRYRGHSVRCVADY